MKIKKKILTINAIILTFSLNISESVSARAGGHSGGGGHSFGGHHSSSHSRSYFHPGRNSSGSSAFYTILNILEAAIAAFVIYSVFFKKSYHSIKLKSRKVLNKINNLRINDAAWDIDEINRRFEDTFFTVQNAWQKRDISLAEDCVSSRLYNSYDKKLKKMIAKNEVNIMRNIRIDEFFIVNVKDGNTLNDTKTLKILFTASLVDYVEDEKSHKLKKGSRSRNSFKEVWKFMYKNNKWILIKIQQIK